MPHVPPRIEEQHGVHTSTPTFLSTCEAGAQWSSAFVNQTWIKRLCDLKNINIQISLWAIYINVDYSWTGSVQALCNLLDRIALTRCKQTCNFVDGKLSYEIKVWVNTWCDENLSNHDLSYRHFNKNLFHQIAILPKIRCVESPFLPKIRSVELMIHWINLT